jgi:DNA-binding GntR family transcriptional regulator
MMTIDPPRELTLERRKSLAEQISDTLVEAIGLGVLQPGERIVESEIAARFRVSRVPVREALKILVTQGILEGESHKGLRVMAIDDAIIGRICEARLAVESIAVQTLLREPDRLRELGPTLDRRIAQIATEIRREDLTAVNRADLGFHSDLCLASGNKIVWTLWQALSRHVWIVFGHEILTESALATMVEEHEELKAALLSGEPSRAIGALRAHIFRQRPEFSVAAAGAPG